MLSTTKMTTVLPVKDMDRARDFYEKSLGLKPKGLVDEDTFIFTSDGQAALQLLRRPNLSASEHTAVSFEVGDLEKEMNDLEGRGVKFEDYDLPGLKTENHIAVTDRDRSAWFTDTEGNILCLHQNLK
ncbi:glyoxalase/Bleomycin resistance protein/Dioxygenase superfamily [Arthrobacter crystallopoietes BAB-32]|uniref:Glyoxalase/Bleomycin resistance protein/Dioxygenase superfamily n=1 Tax=Arthrobacter crystallopoietes BAB-32 TaxID=1246476 RepID=N1V0H6_9MICC|nr:VOC family protein [Arthrobacter crystallopoietes]EMY33592.1 glyoxalase/Bleomycin resistance protein/Dioxygenase superfamily [Arthrobacter crystallopoietes BAB-32]